MSSSSPLAARAGLAAAALALAAGLAGCGGASQTAAGTGAASSGTAAAPAVTVTATVTASPASTPASSSASGGTATAPTSARAGAPGAAACSSRYLRAQAGARQGTAGSIYFVLELVNLNNAPCTLYGYPGVSLAAGTPVTQVGAAADRMAGTPATVTLAPQGIASATLRVVDAGNYSPATCSPRAATYLQVYPPGQTGALYMAYGSTACAKAAVHLLTVGPMRTGTGG